MKTMIAPLHVSSTSTFRSPTVLRGRGTLFWPKIEREATKIDETKAIRSEIARGIRFDRSQGPELHKMTLFSIFTDFELALQVPSS